MLNQSNAWEVANWKNTLGKVYTRILILILILILIYNCLILDDATLIMVDLYVRSFAKIDDVKMEYRNTS